MPAVLLPIETIARELDTNLVLAAALAKRGYRTIVGHREAASAIARLSKRVVWLGKDAIERKLSPTSHEHVADYLFARDSAVIFIQDEGGIFPAHEWDRLVLEKHRAEHLSAKNISRVCVWGRRQSDLLSEHGIPSGVIRVTGCPRLDLCLPQYGWMQNAKVAEMQSGIPPFILMCTRFTSVAHFKALGQFFVSFSSAPRPPTWLDARLATWQRDAHDLAEFVVLVKEVAAAYSGHQIVLRPHPSEDAVFYEGAFKPYRNVLVTREGSALDWIRSAELVVHCNCTTGVEAMLANKPVLNFLPDAIPRGNFDKAVAKEAGITVNSVKQAVDTIGRLIDGGPAKQAWSAEAKSILSNLDAEAIPLLIEQIESVASEYRILSSEIVLPRKSIRNLIGQAIRRRRSTHRMVSDAYLASKRSAFDEEHVETILDGCARSGMGAGRVADFMPNYIVVDPS